MAATLDMRAEHLCEFVALTLEAFHSGTGIQNNAPEPITLDIALRLIQSEIRRTLVAGDEALLGQALWMRIDGKPAAEILRAITQCAAKDAAWCVKCMGARGEKGGQDVVYASVRHVSTPQAAELILASLTEAGCRVRDWTLGPSPV